MAESQADTIVLYECPVCHFKDDVVYDEPMKLWADIPKCPTNGDRMVPVRYIRDEIVQ